MTLLLGRILALGCLLNSTIAFARGEVRFPQENPFAVYTHVVDLRLIHITDSDWRRSEIQANLEEAANVYGQCGVQLRVGKSLRTKTGDGVVMFDLEGYSDPSEKHEEDGALELAKKYADPHTVNIFFQQSFDAEFGSITATAVPAIRAQRADQQVALNTIWMGHRIERQRNVPYYEGGFHSGYSVLAHEMGHVLLNAGHIDDPYTSNLMHEWGQNHNGRLTAEQCETIKKSPLVRRLPVAPSREKACGNLTSPLVGGVYFTHGAERDCGKLNSIVEKLAEVQNEVSDLQPVKHVDFYLARPESQLAYLDRHAFVASLVPTFDDIGKIPLRDSQGEALWLHELGHAILNAQLTVDWPWFQERDNLMIRWGRAVFQATRLENELRVMNMTGQRHAKIENEKDRSEQEILETINEIKSLPNAVEFEDILAPYHEFFADALVVIHANDPRVMKRGLQHPDDLDRELRPEEEPAEIRNRDYSLLRDVDSWTTDEVHVAFTPALAYLWAKMQSSPVEGRTKQEILRIVYFAVSTEILTRTANPDLWKLSVPEANRRLIRLIDQRW